MVQSSNEGTMAVKSRTGRLHEDLAPHAVLHVIAEQDQLLCCIPNAARVCGKHCIRQRLRTGRDVEGAESFAD